MQLNIFKRDLAKDVRVVVDQELERAGDTFIAGQVAQKIVNRLRAEDPELLAKFLDQHAIAIITRMVGDISRAQKTHARAHSGGKQYAKALERHAAGEPAALAAWLDTLYVVTTDQQRKQLRDMDKQDLEFAINDYVQRARINSLQATFLRALAQKVGARTVGEVYTDEELGRMWSSLQ